MVRVLFGVAGTPLGLLGARRNRRAGKVRALDKLVGINPVVTPCRHWSLWGFQRVSRLEWRVVHVVPPDGVDKCKERNREKGRRGFQVWWGWVHEVDSIPVFIKRQLVGKQIYGVPSAVPTSSVWGFKYSIKRLEL